MVRRADGSNENPIKALNIKGASTEKSVPASGEKIERSNPDVNPLSKIAGEVANQVRKWGKKAGLSEGAQDLLKKLTMKNITGASGSDKGNELDKKA